MRLVVAVGAIAVMAMGGAAGAVLTSGAVHPASGEHVAPAAELANGTPGTDAASTGGADPRAVDWSQIAAGPTTPAASLAAVVNQLDFRPLIPTSLKAPALLETSSGVFFARFDVPGGSVWVYADPQSQIPADSLTSIAAECTTCSMTTLATGVAALFMAQPGAPNSVVWDNGNVEWNVIGPAGILSEADALKYASEISKQQVPAAG